VKAYAISRKKDIKDIFFLFVSVQKGFF